MEPKIKLEIKNCLHIKYIFELVRHIHFRLSFSDEGKSLWLLQQSNHVKTVEITYPASESGRIIRLKIIKTL